MAELAKFMINIAIENGSKGVNGPIQAFHMKKM